MATATSTNHHEFVRASIFDEQAQQEIRERLKNLSGYSEEVAARAEEREKYRSEAHNLESVPFEGSIYESVGCALNTDEINQRYRNSMHSVWWIIIQSAWAFLRRKLH